MADAAPLSDRYWFIQGNEAKPIDVPAREFWDQLMRGEPRDPIVRDVSEADGWLITAYEMAEDMQSSEMHPEGDELHYLASGRLGLVLEEDGGDRTIELASGASAVVPKGIWHRFVVRERGQGVSMTFGRGTQHRAVGG